MCRNATGKEGGTTRLAHRFHAMLATAALVASMSAAGHVAAAERVLLVGTYRDMVGSFTSIQAAVNAARPGDWILIAPGVYHEQGSAGAGVLIKTAGIHLRGLDRNGVVVDGTLPGSGTWRAQRDRGVQG
jgi:pectin methylesterase-like acyl-CoA thioesterase